MRLLFNLDKKDYKNCTKTYIRNSARSIIIKNRTLAMVHSLLHDYYKFPGGGIEQNETPVEAMIRETKEEAGLIVKPDTIQEYGYVHRIQKSHEDALQCFIQDNYYYLCEVEKKIVHQHLDNYEKEEQFTLEFVDPKIVIEKNRSVKNSPYDPVMFEREVLIIKQLIKEGLL